MPLTLHTLADQMSGTHLDAHDGAAVLVRGLHLLLDHADSPWETLIASICPAQPIMSDLLTRIPDIVGPPGLDACLAIGVQHAYLRAFQHVLRESAGLLDAHYALDEVAEQSTWLNRLHVFYEQITAYPLHLDQFDLRNFSTSPFIKEYLEQFSRIWLKMRLHHQQYAAFDAQNLARRVSYRIYPALLEQMAANQEFYAPLIDYFQQIGNWDNGDVAAYTAHLLTLPAEPALQSSYALRDLYVAMQTTHVLPEAHAFRYGMSRFQSASPDEHRGPQGQLMRTVLDQLEDREHVVCIQAKPGRGKSAFCAMLAANVALDYPEWLPILVDLQDGRFRHDAPLPEAIRHYVAPYMPLTDDVFRTRRLLLIFDGFDELSFSSDDARGLRRFFFTLAEFQRSAARSNHGRHKIVIAGRPISIQDIESNLPTNFLRLRIEPLTNSQLVMWLANWEKVVGPQVAHAFQTFLEAGNAFQEAEGAPASDLQTVIGTPLLLLLLAELHRHRILTRPEHAAIRSAVEVYDLALSWIGGDFPHNWPLSREQEHLKQHGVSADTLRRVLQEIAICIWHEQRTLVPFAHIRNYLSSAAPRSAKKVFNSGLRGLHNLAISLPFPASPDTPQLVGFSHKSFGEYLAAEKMMLSLRKISTSFAEPVDLESPALQEAAHRFYSVFGVTLLTDEIWEFMMEILGNRYDLDDLRQMTERLYRLYITYSNGRWINEDIARTQWSVLKRYDVPLDLLQFEAQVGINLFVLLCLLYWKTRGTFDICGRPDEGTFDSGRFRKLVAIGELVGTFGLFRRVSHLLSGVNLQEANLVCANLRRADLHTTNLRGAILRDANLRGANLRNACLQDADLRVASLQNADLRNATCMNANLEDADLRDANLTGSNFEKASLLCTEMRDAEFSRANLRGAVLYGAMLQGSNFEEADVTGAIISKQQLARDIDLFTEEQVAQFQIVDD